MQNLQIIKVPQNAVDQLQKIGRQTFFETFASSNTVQNMQSYLEKGFVAENIQKELSDENIAYYFAKIGKKIIGYLKLNINQAQTESKLANALEIERIYVLKEFQGKKVGQVLFEKALSIAKELKVEYVWLGVWEQNPQAINFYKKNGFVEFDKHIFMLGDDKQIDLLMKIRI